MSLWVLDTDHVSLFQGQHPLVRQRFNEIATEEVAVTVITAEEQMRGWLNAIRRAAKPERTVWAYAGLREALDYFNGVKLLDFDRAASVCYEDLVRQRIRIGTRDLRIAAIVLSLNGILVTRNRRDFERVPGLIWEDWTIPESTLER